MTGPAMDLAALNEFVYTMHYKQEAHMAWADNLAEVITYNAQYVEGVYRGAQELGSKVERIRVGHDATKQELDATKQEMKDMKDTIESNDAHVKTMVVSQMTVHEEAMNALYATLKDDFGARLKHMETLISDVQLSGSGVPGDVGGIELKIGTVADKVLEVKQNLERMGERIKEKVEGLEAQFAVQNSVNAEIMQKIAEGSVGTSARAQVGSMGAEGVPAAAAPTTQPAQPHQGDPWWQTAAPAPSTAAAAAAAAPAPAYTHAHTSDYTHPRQDTREVRLYDDRVVNQGVYAFDEKDVFTWWKKAKNYMIGNCNDTLPLFAWIELRGTKPVTKTDVAELQNILMVEKSVSDMNSKLWSFLNLPLSGNAKLTFDNNEALQGIEPLRQLLAPVFSRTAQRRQDLYKKVVIRDRVGKLNQLMPAVEAWELDMAMFMAAGGEVMHDEQRRTILMNMLPAEVPMSILWELQKQSDYDTLLEHLRHTITFMNELGGKPNYANNVEPEVGVDQQDGESEESMEEWVISNVLLMVQEGHSDTEIQAFVKQQRAPGGRPAGSPGDPSI